MWHFMCRNRVRNGSERKPETLGQNSFTKTCTFKKSYRRCIVILPWGCASIHWISTKNSWLDRRFLLHLNAVLIICVITNSTVLCVVLHTVHRNLSATFGECIRCVSGLLSRPFLTRFPRTRCHIKEWGFGNKMFISDLITVSEYLHTTGFKNRWGINCAKCIYNC